MRINFSNIIHQISFACKPEHTDRERELKQSSFLSKKPDLCNLHLSAKGSGSPHPLQEISPHNLKREIMRTYCLSKGTLHIELQCYVELILAYRQFQRTKAVKQQKNNNTKSKSTWHTFSCQALQSKHWVSDLLRSEQERSIIFRSDLINQNPVQTQSS